MQLVCSSAESGSDVRCPVCGQGFLLYWTRNSPGDQPELVSVIMDALARQHSASDANAHDSSPALGGPHDAPGAPALLIEARWGYC